MCSILVIDDQEDVLELIRKVLTHVGHDVETAADGYEGVEKFDQGNFDVVITDIKMPGMDGNMVAHHIRNSRNHQTPVIAITGTPWLQESSPFDEIIPKPFPLQKMIETVKHFTRSEAI